MGSAALVLFQFNLSGSPDGAWAPVATAWQLMCRKDTRRTG